MPSQWFIELGIFSPFNKAKIINVMKIKWHSNNTQPILVITVAHNPLRASRVPVYTNQCKHSWSIVKLHILNNLKGNFST